MFSLWEFASEARPNGVRNPNDGLVLISLTAYRNGEIISYPSVSRRFFNLLNHDGLVV